MNDTLGKKTRFFFGSLLLLIVFLFRNTFSLYFFADDFHFLALSRIDSVSDFFQFFSPYRDFFYRPLSTEVFYWFIHLVNYQLQIVKIVVFTIYFVGLFYVWKTIHFLTKTVYTATLTMFLYGVSFIHVYQLYWLATFQEVALFTSLIISFYFFLTKKHTISILAFLIALLSKETAVLYVPFLLLYIGLIQYPKSIPEARTYLPILLPYLLVSLMCIMLYIPGIDSNSTTTTEYQINFSPSLIINNSIWYAAWSFGFPEALPDYMPSIFSLPIPQFYSFFDEVHFTEYVITLSGFLTLFIVSVSLYLYYKKGDVLTINYFLRAIFIFISFFLFLAPFLVIQHKWMVRLTIPLVFVSFFQAYIITVMMQNRKYLLRYIGFGCLLSYVLFNYYGVTVHEHHSTYLLESSISQNVRQVLIQDGSQVRDSSYLFFRDSEKVKNAAWQGSEKIKVTLNDQSFLDYYFPDSKDIEALYDFEEQLFPKDRYEIDSYEMTN